MIEALNLSKRYGPAVAVDRLSFQIQPGRVTGFLGPNGAGKSTTIRMILGLDTPSGGTAVINGNPYRALKHPLREVGSLLDAGTVHRGMLARQHLAWLAVSNGLPRQRITDVLARTGLESVASKRLGTFSLGMLQRLGIAAALLGDPPVLVLDEPVNGLDPAGVHWIRGLMRGLAAEGRTVFVSSHLMSEMALTAQHLLVIGQGRLLADTGMTQFIQASNLNDILVRSPQAAALAALLTAKGATVTAEPGDALAVTGLSAEKISELAAAHAIAVYELTHRQASLEQAYLKLTEKAELR
jgi:ABC-2 type transport system ATP-binding protein